MFSSASFLNKASTPVFSRPIQQPIKSIPLGPCCVETPPECASRARLVIGSDDDDEIFPGSLVVSSRATPFHSFCFSLPLSLSSHAQAGIVGVETCVDGDTRSRRTHYFHYPARCVPRKSAQTILPGSRAPYRSPDVYLLVEPSSGHYSYRRWEGSDGAARYGSEARFAVWTVLREDCMAGSALIQACEAAGATIPRYVQTFDGAGLSLTFACKASATTTGTYRRV